MATMVAGILEIVLSQNSRSILSIALIGPFVEGPVKQVRVIYAA